MFGAHFNSPVLAEQLPSSIKHITLLEDFCKPLDFLLKLQKLTHFCLATRRRRAVKNFLPNTLTHLSFKGGVDDFTDYQQPLEPTCKPRLSNMIDYRPVRNLPPSLTHIRFSDRFNAETNEMNLPHNIKYV